jgi:hypothetical protein
VTAEADAIGGSAGAEESPNGAPTPAAQAVDPESATPGQTAPGRARFAQPND